jgi:hypothetical protein
MTIFVQIVMVIPPFNFAHPRMGDTFKMTRSPPLVCLYKFTFSLRAETLPKPGRYFFLYHPLLGNHR